MNYSTAAMCPSKNKLENTQVTTGNTGKMSSSGFLSSLSERSRFWQIVPLDALWGFRTAAKLKMCQVSSQLTLGVRWLPRLQKPHGKVSQKHQSIWSTNSTVSISCSPTWTSTAAQTLNTITCCEERAASMSYKAYQKCLSLGNVC